MVSNSTSFFNTQKLSCFASTQTSIKPSLYIGSMAWLMVALEKSKELLAKYGGAYLATSITLSLISSLCYALISAGIDVQALLQKVGISTDVTGGKVGTFALAHAAHKAASPMRFPPTVALTPVVAS
uniref:DUF1279 domain-containing protein n=1 Tax=Gossypium raimondii TaxID=29730 RepID=A0A0D2QFL5_GOSRA|nr:hypothetical protein B456_001G123800 [Gossypium raimondii]